MADCVSGNTEGKRIRTGITREKGASSSEMSILISSEEESPRHDDNTASSSVYKSSEEYFEYSCDPCKPAGDNVEAWRFCTDCKEYLCSTCFRSHSRCKTSRHHTLLDIDSMPEKPKLCDPCETVGDEEEAVGYCKECREYLCSSCLKGHSRSKPSRHHVLMNKNSMPKRSGLCDPCKTASDEEETVGYCQDCGEYLCSSCFRGHSRIRATRRHVLLDKDNTPDWTDKTLASSLAQMTIYERDANSQRYAEKYAYIQDINVKASNDKEDCYITGMTMVTSSELVVADNNNKSLKLIDLENNVIKYSLELQTCPDGLTVIFEDQVAVVLCKQSKIQILSVAGTMSVVRTLNTDGVCLDIKFVNGKFYVSFKEPVKFQILRLTGAVHKTIKPDPEVLERCSLPLHIAVSPDESMISISDWKTNKVICLDMNWRMISMYEGELELPHDKGNCLPV